MTRAYGYIPKISHDIKSAKDRKASKAFNNLRLESENIRYEYRVNKGISDYLKDIILKSKDKELLDILNNHSKADVRAL